MNAVPAGLPEVAILVVEDDPDHCELTVNALSAHCAPGAIATAADGEEALDFMFGRGAHQGRDTRKPPRLVLLDMNLPRLNGLDVLRAMRADPRTRSVPVVMLSASSEKQALDSCYALGANSVVRKTSDFDELHRKMGRVYDFWITVNEGDRHSRV